MKKSILILLLPLFLFISVQPVSAKLLPRFAGMAKKTAGVSSGVIISPKLRSDRKALNLYFSNLTKAKNITYTLIYQTTGKDEGISGSLDSSAGDSTTRELLFGTCSSGVCRYHADIKNMKLEIISELHTGKKFLRRFRIRI